MVNPADQVASLASSHFQREFEICYQPVLRLGQYGICGFDVLLNVQQERQMLYPAALVGMIDQTGLSVYFRDWILQHVCRQVSQWRQKYSWISPLSLSLHLSEKQLLSPGLLDQIHELKLKYPLVSDEICIELTSNLLIKKAALIQPLIHQLLEMGLHLRINDFYPSNATIAGLNYFGVDKVKLSPQFIHSLSIDPARIDVFMPIIDAIRDNNIHVTIDGFQTASQLVVIRQISCENWSLLCGLPTPAQQVSHLVSEASNTVPIRLEEYIHAMYKLSQCVQSLLGEKLVAKYWLSERPTLDWLSVQTPTSITEIRRLTSQNLDVNQIVLLQLWVEKFMKRCSRVLPSLENIVKKSDITPAEFRLMKLSY